MRSVINTPAKINLYLDVLGKRPDGYHNIRSVMQSVSLCDTVTVTEDNKISVICDYPGVPTDEKNIAYKAAKLFFERSYISGGCRIELEKHIPAAGGLAGGSTDGAAVLSALNSMYGVPFTEDELLRMGAELGADVPFCIKKGCALCEGVGEIMTVIPTKLSFDLVIARGGESISTPAAYKLIDEKYGDDLIKDFGNIDSVAKALISGNIGGLKDNVYNIFESVILPTHTCAGKIKELMTENGALFSLMSGSGPSVFGIFETSDKASSAAQAIKDAGYEAYACRTIT